MRQAAPAANAANLRRAAQEAGHVAVMILGTTRRIPRDFGDNEGCWPVKVATTSSPRDYLRTDDRGWEEITVFACVWTNGQGFAERLKAAIEYVLAKDGTVMRRAWHSLDPMIAELAVAAVAEHEGIEIFDGEERQRRLQASVEKKIWQFRMRR